MAVPVRRSWVDAFASEPTPGGVRYDEILLGPQAGKLRAIAAIVSGVFLFVVLAPTVSQLLGWLGWVIFQPGGDVTDWLRSLAAFEHPWGMFAGHIALALLIPISLAVVLFFHRRHPRWLASVRPWFRWRYLVISMGLALVVFNLFLFLSHLGQPFPHLQPQRDYWVFLVLILLTSPLQAAAEEYLFRGYLLQAFGSFAATPWVGIIASSVLFAAFHGGQNLPLFVNRLAFGLLAAILVWRTGGLEAGIAAHVINNISAYGLAALTGSIAALRSITAIGWTSSLIDIVGFALFATVAIGIARRSRLDNLTPSLERP